MAPLARQYGGGAGTVGLLLAAAPLGMALGGVALTRFCPPAARPRLILPLAAMSAGVLTVTWLVPPLWMMLLLLALAGAASAFAIPLNALFGRAVPRQYRGRAFGVAITGLSGLQGTADGPGGSGRRPVGGHHGDRVQRIVRRRGGSRLRAAVAAATCLHTCAVRGSPVEQARTPPNADSPTADAGRRPTLTSAGRARGSSPEGRGEATCAAFGNRGISWT